MPQRLSPYEENDVFAAPYAARIEQFTVAGRQAGLTPAASDRERIAVILVDYQHDFVHPDGTLAVPGAREDVARFLKWFYANAPRITSIYASLDTHLPRQIFFSSWWKDRAGHHPPAYTTITGEAVQRGDWIPQVEVEWSRNYVGLLRQQAKKELMIWPYHTMEGTLGHMLSAPVSEAIAWHSAARQTQPTFIAKGRTVRTEFYGIFGAEVADPFDQSSYLNLPLLDAIQDHVRIYIAGEAKSHCVLETVKQSLKHFQSQPDWIKRLYFLQDCTSCVKTAAHDFTPETEAALAAMAQQGVQMVNSTDRIL
jgi:nicotinamidase/pyrazinamidase